MLLVSHRNIAKFHTKVTKHNSKVKTHTELSAHANTMAIHEYLTVLTFLTVPSSASPGLLVGIGPNPTQIL